MGAPYHSIHHLIEDTVKGFILQLGDPGINVYTYGEVAGLGEMVQEPYIGIRCAQSSPTIDEVALSGGIGNRTCRLEIAVRTHTDDQTDDADTEIVVKMSRIVHAELVSRVMDLFARTDAVDEMNKTAAQVGGVGIDQIDQPEEQTEIVDRSYVTNLVYSVMAHPQL